MSKVRYNPVTGDFEEKFSPTGSDYDTAGGVPVPSLLRNDQNGSINGRLAIGKTGLPEAQLDITAGSAGTRPVWDSNDVAIIENASHLNTVVNVLSASDKSGAVAFSDTDSRIQGAVAYDHSTENMDFYQNNTKRLTLDENGLTGLIGQVTFPEQAAPSTPASGYSTLYPDSTGLWSFTNDAGVNYNLVKDVLESGGTKLTYGAVTDGEYVKRSGSTLVSAAIPNATPTTRGLEYQPIKEVQWRLEYVGTGSIKIKVVGNAGKAQMQVTNGTLWITTQLSADITIDITTTGANGRDTGSRSNHTLWYVWHIHKSSDGTNAGLLSTSMTSPTMPSGYDYKQLLNCIRDGNIVSAQNIVKFVHDGTTGAMRYDWRDTAGIPGTSPTAGTNGTATTATAVDFTGHIPAFARGTWVQLYATPGTVTAAHIYWLYGTTYGAYTFSLAINEIFTVIGLFPIGTGGLTNSCYYFFSAATTNRSSYTTPMGWWV